MGTIEEVIDMTWDTGQLYNTITESIREVQDAGQLYEVWDTGQLYESTLVTRDTR